MYFFQKKYLSLFSTFKKLTIVLIFSFLFNLGTPLTQESLVSAAGATLFLSPATGSFTVGTNFSVAVKINSGGGVGINAADGMLLYNTSYLSVESLSYSGPSSSIFNLWPTQPSFSNTNGEISFAGGSPSAYTGTSGSVLVITFRAKKEGSTRVSFSSGSVLANDGQGTDVLSSFGEGNYTLKGASAPAEKEEETIPYGVLPSLPKISSVTHPEPENWYSNNTPEFSWELPPDTIGLSFLVHDYPTANPDYVSEGLLDSTKYEEAIDDGTWYFHLKFKNNYGWGVVAHRKILIDTVAPEQFEIEVRMTDPTDPQPILVFESSDELSGIDHYEVKIGEGEFYSISSEGIAENPYQMPIQSPGERRVEVRAVDKAGNFSFALTSVNIEALKPPVITEIPEKITEEEVLIVKGISFYPEAKVEFYIQGNGEEIKGQAVTDENGDWNYICAEKFEKGEYEVWAKVIDKRGAQSSLSKRTGIKIIPRSFIKAFAWLIIIILIIIILILMWIMFDQRKKCLLKIKKIKKETQDIKNTTERVFAALAEEVEEQIDVLDKKPRLSNEEKKAINKLKEALNISRDFINKEIKDVEEELKEKETKNRRIGG